MSVVSLLRGCEKRITQLYAEELRGRTGVTTAQRLVLVAVKHHTGGTDHTTLVKETGIDRSTLGQIVHLLKSQGLLFQSRADWDGRKAIVSISSEGRKALKIAERAAKSAEQAFLNEIPKAQRATFLEALGKAAATS